MLKMDMCWIVAASLIYPNTASTFLVTQLQIEKKAFSLFGAKITPTMISKHLVSWEDRQADQQQPERGGSRNRYFFRTVDGRHPSVGGDFRLIKQTDAIYDGQDKTARTVPNREDVPQQYHYLLDWYEMNYR